jgi:2-(1,2-epoxy-1,2-dihydrophenyl)acetyl-CoA isomerase
MKATANLTTDNELFSSALENGVLIVRQKQHLLRMTHDIHAIFSFYEYLESMLTSRAYRALAVFGVPEHARHADHGRFLCKALTAGRESKVLDRLANVVNRLIVTLSTLNAVTVYAGQGRISLFNLNLALAYDYRIAADDTAFENPNAAIGLITKGSGYFLPRLLGVRKATEVLQWPAFGAEEALQLGIVDRIVPAARLEEETMRFVSESLAGPSATLLGVRKLLKCDINELERSLAQEDKLIKERLESPDFRQTFVEYCEKAYGCDMESMLKEQ